MGKAGLGPSSSPKTSIFHHDQMPMWLLAQSIPPLLPPPWAPAAAPSLKSKNHIKTRPQHCKDLAGMELPGASSFTPPRTHSPLWCLLYRAHIWSHRLGFALVPLKPGPALKLQLRFWLPHGPIPLHLFPLLLITFISPAIRVEAWKAPRCSPGHRPQRRPRFLKVYFGVQLTAGKPEPSLCPAPLLTSH